MNLRWLEDFLAVCETRSFTDAARSRFLTRSALSKHMQALEVWLGVGALLDRSTSPVGVTYAGLAFKETAAQIVMLLNSARRATQIADRLVAHAKSAYTETLRAGVLAGLGVAWLLYSLIRGNLEDGELTLASNDVSYYIPLSVDVYRQKSTSREEVLQCWEVWRTYAGGLNHLRPALPGIA